MGLEGCIVDLGAIVCRSIGCQYATQGPVPCFVHARLRDSNSAAFPFDPLTKNRPD